MKISSNLILASTLSLGAATAFAASSTTINVAGKVAAGSCTTAGSTLDLDLGVIPDRVPDSNFYFSPVREVELLVTCTAPTAIAIKVHDNRSADKPTEPISFLPDAFQSYFATPDSFYGLQDKASARNIGAYLVGFDGILVDDGDASGGFHSEVAISNDGKNWRKGRNTRFQFTGDIDPYVMPAVLGAGVPTAIPGTTFSVPVSILATLMKDRLPPNLENLSVEGSASFEIIYL